MGGITASEWARLTGHKPRLPDGVAGLSHDAVGAIGDSTAATTAHVIELDSKIRVLDTDVSAEASGASAQAFHLGKWIPFFTAWQAWFAENGTVPIIPLPGINFNAHKSEDFVVFSQQYNELLREWTETLGMPSSAKPSAVGQPPTWFESAKSALGTTGLVIAGAAVAYAAFELFLVTRKV